MRVKRPELVLAGAVLVSLPMIPGILNGNISLLVVGLRFAGAVVAWWLFMAVLTWTFETYSEQARRSQVMRALEEQRPSTGQRREPTDPPAP